MQQHDFILSNKIDEILISNEALKTYATRNNTSSETEKLNDYYRGMHLAKIDVADSIINLLKNDRDGLIFSKNVFSHLDDVSLEEYKSVLAYYNWINKGRHFDGYKDRIEEDWGNGASFLTWYTQQDTPGDTDESLKDYLRECCTSRKDEIIDKKAYWLHLAYPYQDAETNHIKAENYVNNFYNLDILIKALEGNTGYRNKLENLVLENPEIANMLEVNIFRLKKVV